MESAALLHSSLTRFSCRQNSTLRLSRLNSTTLPRNVLIRTTNSNTLPRRSLRLFAKAACENHHHYHHEHDHHHHQNHHQHCCSVELTVSNHTQKLLLKFAKAIGWIRLANFLRENLHLCCSSVVLFLAAAACPHLMIPKHYITPIQNSFMIVAFPLVGVRFLNFSELCFFDETER